MNFQQLKIKKFRGLSTHFVVFQELIAYLQSAKNGKGTFMILFNFSKMLLFSKHFTHIRILASVQKDLSVKICII